MNLLALDTSSDYGSVVLAVDGETADAVCLERSLQHSETVFRAIDFLLAGRRIGVDQIDLFVAARGPGSFTGLRVGMAAAEGLAFGNGGQVCAVSTLAALAWQAGAEGTLVSPLMDARRGEVYGALFRRHGDRLEEVRAPEVADPRIFLDSLPEARVVFVGPGVKHCTSGIRARAVWSIRECDPCLARAIADMARAGYREPFEPLYLRPPGAQPARSAEKPGNEAR